MLSWSTSWTSTWQPPPCSSSSSSRTYLRAPGLQPLSQDPKPATVRHTLNSVYSCHAFFQKKAKIQPATRQRLPGGGFSRSRDKKRLASVRAIPAGEASIVCRTLRSSALSPAMCAVLRACWSFPTFTSSASSATNRASLSGAAATHAAAALSAASVSAASVSAASFRDLGSRPKKDSRDRGLPAQPDPSRFFGKRNSHHLLPAASRCSFLPPQTS